MSDANLNSVQWQTCAGVALMGYTQSKEKTP